MMCWSCEAWGPELCEDCGYAVYFDFEPDGPVLCEGCADERENQDNAGAIG